MIDKLQSMDAKDLLQLAIKQGHSPHHKLGKDKLIKMIVDGMNTPPAPISHTNTEIPEGTTTLPKEPQKPNTQDEVLAAIAQYTARGMEAHFTDTTWHFIKKAGRMKAEDSGNLAIPLRVIVMKAQTVARGPLMIKTQNAEDFGGGITQNPVNAHTNQVLA